MDNKQQCVSQKVFVSFNWWHHFSFFIGWNGMKLNSIKLSSSCHKNVFSQTLIMPFIYISKKSKTFTERRQKRDKLKQLRKKFCDFAAFWESAWLSWQFWTSKQVFKCWMVPLMLNLIQNSRVVTLLSCGASFLLMFCNHISWSYNLFHLSNFPNMFKASQYLLDGTHLLLERSYYPNKLLKYVPVSSNSGRKVQLS